MDNLNNLKDFESVALKQKWVIEDDDFNMEFVVGFHNDSIDRLMALHRDIVLKEIAIVEKRSKNTIDRINYVVIDQYYKIKKFEETIEKMQESLTWHSDYSTNVGKKIEIYEDALDKLSRLGNYPNYGNSIGNEIAINALEKAKQIK